MSQTCDNISWWVGRKHSQRHCDEARDTKLKYVLGVAANDVVLRKTEWDEWIVRSLGQYPGLQ